MSNKNISIVSKVMNALGRKAITSIDDDPWGEVINDVVNNLYPTLLEKYHFSFCIRYAVLSQEASNNNPVFNYAFILPSSLLKIVGAYSFYYENAKPKQNTELQYREYEIATLFFADHDKILLKYTSYDVELFNTPNSFQLALAYRVAAEVAPVLMEKPSLVPYYEQKYRLYFDEAVKLDSVNASTYESWNTKVAIY